MKRLVIQLSFKGNGSDLELYNHLQKKLNAPSYIKEILWSIYKDGTFCNETPNVSNKNDTHLFSLIQQKQDLFNEHSERDEIIWD